MFTVKEIVDVCDGKLIYGNENKEVVNFSKDTRQINKGDMYVSIKGESLDGNKFIIDALEKGAIGAIINDTSIDLSNYQDREIIMVEDSITAIQNLAKYKREKYNIPVIAITGSVGKTSTKDIIANVVSKKYNVLKTEGNLNNEIGLPLTLLKLDNHEAIVVEMGMNNFGEIKTLTNIAKPTIVVLTNIGTAHIGNLGSRQNILKAKLEILEGLKANGTVVINNDNDLLNKLEIRNFNVNTYGIENISNYNAYNIKPNEKETTYDININSKTYTIEVPVGGIHFVYNSLPAICIGKLLNIEMEDIIDGIKNFKLTKMRMDIRKMNDDITIINDAYNASFDSMKAILEYLKTYKGNRKIAVLGDMKELGDYSRQMHENVGIEVAKNNVDILITVGEDSKYIAKKAEELGTKEVYSFINNNEVVAKLNSILKPQDVVVLKAANSMKLYEIMENIENKITNVYN